MKKYTKTELVSYLRTELLGTNMDDAEIQYINPLIEIIVNDLYDISKEEINGFDVKSTFIIRKLFGVFDNGVFQTMKTASEISNVSSNYVSIVKERILRKWTRYFRFKSKNILSDNNDKTIIKLSDPIQKLNLSFSSFRSLYRNSIETIEDLTSLSRYDLNEILDDDYEKNLIIKTINELGYSVSLLKYPEQGNLRFIFSDLTCKCLERVGVNTLDELISLCMEDLKEVLDNNSLNEINNCLEECGLSLSKKRNSTLSDLIEKLNIDGITYSRLKNANVNTLGELISFISSDLIQPEIGIVAYNKILRRLKARGFSLSEKSNNTVEQTQKTNNSVETEQFNQTSEQVNLLEQYKSLLLEKKELQQRLTELDTKIMTLLEQINQNQIGETNGQSKK